MQSGKRIWQGAEDVSAGMISNLVIFSTAFAGLIFLIRPRMRKHKKIDLKIFEYVE